MPSKGERTRRHLIDVAMAAFEEAGFHGTTMRTIAARAEVSVGLAYRYFDSKEAIVLAFFEQVSTELSAMPIDGDTLGQRFVSVMRHRFALVHGHQRALGSLLGAMLDPDGPVGILSPKTAPVRTTTRLALRRAIEGAQGVPQAAVEPLVRLAYLGHALLLLAWVQKPAAADALLDQVGAALDAAVPWLGSPLGEGLLQRVVGALEGFDGG